MCNLECCFGHHVINYLKLIILQVEARQEECIIWHIGKKTYNFFKGKRREKNMRTLVMNNNGDRNYEQ